MISGIDKERMMTVKWVWHETDKELPDYMGEYLIANEDNCIDIADFSARDRRFTYPAHHLSDTWTLANVRDITDKVVQWAEIPLPVEEG